MTLSKTTALWIFVFLVSATIPYALLISNFGYDDILRAPPLEIMQKFNDGGPQLIWTWLAFALSALLFIPAATGMAQIASPSDRSSGLLNGIAIAAALVQCIGLLRWVFVVPFLAATAVDPASSPAAQTTALQLFQAFHQFGGVLLGEFIGQLLLATWTLLLLWKFYKSKTLPRFLVYVGGLTVPLWILGMSEHLHTTLPQLRVIATTPAAFMLFEAWLLVCAIVLWRRSTSRQLS